MRSRPAMTTEDSTQDHEIWYPVAGCPDFEFSSNMRVRIWRSRNGKGGCPAKPRLVKLFLDSFGYTCFNARPHGPVRLQYVIWEHMFGPRPRELVLRHLDDCKTNNYLANLSLGTRADNVRDAVRNGRTARGSQCGTAKLSEQDVPRIRAMRAAGATHTQIAQAYGVSRRAIGKLDRGETWSHVSSS